MIKAGFHQRFFVSSSEEQKTNKRVQTSAPRTTRIQKIKRLGDSPEGLRQLQWLVNDPFLFLVIADFRVSGKWEILSQGVTFESIVGKDTASDRVSWALEAVVVGAELFWDGGSLRSMMVGLLQLSFPRVSSS